MKVFLFTTILFSGLTAGLFYSYSCSVNSGLKMLDDAAYIKAMQSINIAIQNPLFFLSFLGLLITFPITAIDLYKQHSNLFYLFVIALSVYFVAVFGVTVFFNVPLNEQLAKFPVPTANENELSAMRQAFEKPWNTFHSIRTVASVVSFGLCIIVIINQKL